GSILGSVAPVAPSAPLATPPASWRAPAPRSITCAEGRQAATSGGGGRRPGPPPRAPPPFPLVLWSWRCAMREARETGFPWVAETVRAPGPKSPHRQGRDGWDHGRTGPMVTTNHTAAAAIVVGIDVSKAPLAVAPRPQQAWRDPKEAP